MARDDDRPGQAGKALAGKADTDAASGAPIPSGTPSDDVGVVSLMPDDAVPGEEPVPSVPTVPATVLDDDEGALRGSLEPDPPQLSDDADATKDGTTSTGDTDAGTGSRSPARRMRRRIFALVAPFAAPVAVAFLFVIILYGFIGTLVDGSGSSSSSTSSQPWTVSRDEGANDTTPHVEVDYDGLRELFADWDDSAGITTPGEEVADLAARLALSAVNSGDPNAELRQLGLYGNTPGKYTYGSEGRIHAHEPADGTIFSDTSHVPPDPRIPKAQEWIDFQQTVGKTRDGTKVLSGRNTFADCAAMPWDCWQYLHSDLNLSDDYGTYGHTTVKLVSYGGKGVPARELIGPTGRHEGVAFTYIMSDPTKTWEEQLQPGDILCNGTIPHYMLYIGNEIAQKYFPGTTGFMGEAGHRSQAYWGITDGQYYKPDGQNWWIMRYRGTETYAATHKDKD